jgi:tetratricopeptide (TPR) repeat protein
LRPDDAAYHYNLGIALSVKGRLDDAVAAYQKAIALQPDYARAHYGLGNALYAMGRLDDAVAAYQKAIALQPDYAEAHCNLGRILLRTGDFTAALVARRRGHELGMKQPNWHSPSAQWVQEADQLVELDAKLPRFLQREAQPRDDAERLALAQCCGYKRRYVAAVGFWQQVFAHQPSWAEDRHAGHRYNAACAAALAAAVKGTDAADLSEQGRTTLRAQALSWLRADLAAWAKLLKHGQPADRTTVRQTLQHWQRDPDFTGVRDEAALAKLPEAERSAWRQLWADVAALLQQAERKEHTSSDQGAKTPGGVNQG